MGRCLSIQQPWLAAIMSGEKTIENRTWPAPARIIGQEIGLHASKAVDWDAPAMAWTAAGFPSYEGWEPRQEWRSKLLLGAIAAFAVVTGCHHAGECGICDPWAAYGQYHWQIASVRPLAEPVPCRGALGLWEY